MSQRDLSRRKLFMHPAHPTIGVSSGLAALQACQSAACLGVAHQPTGPLRVCLLADSTPARSDHSLAALKAALKAIWNECLAGHTADYTWAFCTADHCVRGFETLDRCDCLILLGPATIAGQPLEQIDRFCRQGGAIVGLRAMGGVFQDGSVLRTKLFGVDCEDCYDQRVLRIVRAAAADHPVLDGVDDFVAPVALYRQCRLVPDASILLTAAAADGRQPVAWVRLHQGARVFCTSLGRDDDFQVAAFRRLLGNALCWTTRRVD